MPTLNIFDKPFDEGTITKLEIFEKYLDSWLPTFILSKYDRPIQIFDLFAGAGVDIKGVEGSPLRILRIIQKYTPILRSKNKKVNLYLNDFDKSKITTLKDKCYEKIKEYDIEDVVILNISEIPFDKFLIEYKSKLDYGCNLIFIDQNGFKEVTEDVFKYLINIDTSEFIFFISSSYLHRFAKDPEIQKYHPKFDFSKIVNCNRKDVHRIICQEFHKYVPQNIKNFGLLPFSIMKSDNNNVYGLIFVSKHILGADKFLDVVWKMNFLNGNANYDIDEDVKKAQIDLFDGKSMTKIEGFQNKLNDLILKNKLITNRDFYEHTINAGHIPKHAFEEIVKMKKNGLINFDGRSPLVNYKKVVKERRIIAFKILKSEEN